MTIYNFRRGFYLSANGMGRGDEAFDMLRGLLGLSRLLVVGVLGVGALAYWGECIAAEGDKPASGQVRSAYTVTTTYPHLARVPSRVFANGTVYPWAEASVSSEIGGVAIREINVNVGDTVRAGQVLVVLASEALEAAVAEANARVNEASAMAEEAIANAERVRSAKDSGTLSAQQIYQVFQAEMAANARLEAAKAILRGQQIRLGQTKVIAPDDGVITARLANLGGVVVPGMELFRLIRRGRLEWRAEVGANEMVQIKGGQGVRLSLPGGGQVRGRVRVVAPNLDPQTRQGLVYVDLEGGNPLVRSGVFARGEIQVGLSQSLFIPQEALVLRDGFAWVFIVDKGGRVSQVKVISGRRLANQVEATVENEKSFGISSLVVVRGAGFLNHGDLVTVAGHEATKAVGVEVIEEEVAKPATPADGSAAPISGASQSSKGGSNTSKETRNKSF